MVGFGNEHLSAFDNVDKLPLTDEQVKKSFGINTNQLYNILEAADERLYKKMFHVFQKYRNDVTNESKSIDAHRMDFLLECFHNGINEEETDLIF